MDQSSPEPQVDVDVYINTVGERLQELELDLVKSRALMAQMTKQANDTVASAFEALDAERKSLAEAQARNVELRSRIAELEGKLEVEAHDQ